MPEFTPPSTSAETSVLAPALASAVLDQEDSPELMKSRASEIEALFDARYQRSIAAATEWLEMFKTVAEENRSKMEALSKRDGADMSLQDRYAGDVARAPAPTRFVGKLV